MITDLEFSRLNLLRPQTELTKFHKSVKENLIEAEKLTSMQSEIIDEQL